MRERLLLGPGPSPVHPRVREALARPLLGHLDPEFLGILDEISAMLRDAFRTTNALTFAVSGTGSAGMETALVNLLEEGDTAIVGVCGAFGARMAEMARRCGAEVVRVEAPWGESIPSEAVEEALTANPEAKLVALVHAETSTGVWQPIEEVGSICRGRETLFVVDAVTSLAGIPLEVDAWGIDVCYSGTQKCLSVPPGLAPITFSERAVDAIDRRATPVRSWYLDVTLIRRYLGQERLYHHTAPISMLFGLHAGVRIALEEGLEERWSRHERVGRAFQKRLEELRFTLFVEEEHHRLPQLTAALVPDGIDARELKSRLLREHGIEIGGGLADQAEKMVRVGLMGEGARKENADRLLDALRTFI